MTSRRIGSSIVLLTALIAVAAPSRALIGWMPASAGIPPTPYFDANDDVHFFQTTRRLVARDDLPGEYLVGNIYSGLFRSTATEGWVSLTPNCLPPLHTTIGSAQGLLDSCGVEGIAVDPVDPLTIYVSTFEADPLGGTGALDHGGVYRADLRGLSGSGGVLWKKLLGGVRGNGLAVSRANSISPARILAGRIQYLNSDVGVDSNICASVGRTDRCSPSVYLSADGGTTWTPKYFEPAPCTNTQSAVSTSSRIVGNIAFDPVSPSVAYAAANSGVWSSTDGGSSWTNALAACGSNPGIAITTTGPQRIYAGTFDGKIRVADTGSSGPGAFTELTQTGGRVDGQVLSIVLDSRDTTQRTMFVSAWTAPPLGGGGVGGIFKVRDLGNGSATVERLGDDLVDLLPVPIDDSDMPYPLSLDPKWRPSLFLAQNPLLPNVLSVSTVLGGVFTSVER